MTTTLEVTCPTTGRIIEVYATEQYDTEGDASLGPSFTRSYSGYEIDGAIYQDTGERLDEIPDAVREAVEAIPVSTYDPANDL
jgi:hypothetical protein